MQRSVFLVVLLLGCFVFFGTAQADVELKPIDDQEVKEGKELSFEIEAVSDNGPVDFFTVDMPDGAHLENFQEVSPGVFTCDFIWEPDYTQAGGYDVVIIAKDASDDEDACGFHIEVEDVNRLPDPPENPVPFDGEEVVYSEGSFVFSWDGDLVDEDGDQVKFLIEVWKKGEASSLFSAGNLENSYEIMELLEAAVYQWQVTAIDEHGAEAEGPMWEFTADQWFRLSAEAETFAVMIRKPGEYTGKWTDVTFQSNGDLAVYFEVSDAVGPNDEEIEIVYGVKVGAGDIEWHNNDWTMKIDFPEDGYTFSLYFKIKAEAFHSSGLYQGGINLIVSMKN